MRSYVLEEMKNVDIRTVDKNTLVDICSIKINNTLSPEKRKMVFIEKIKNPYCFLCGDVAVKISFSDNGDSLENIVDKLIKTKIM